MLTRKGCPLLYRDPSIRVYLSRDLPRIPCHISPWQTAKNVRESYDALAEVFECIENFLRRLGIYSEIPPTHTMTEMVIKIMVELISVLALATEQINQGRFSMSVLTYNYAYLTSGREIRKETFGRKRHRISAAPAR